MYVGMHSYHGVDLGGFTGKSPLSRASQTSDDHSGGGTNVDLTISKAAIIIRPRLLDTILGKSFRPKKKSTLV
jgi:hypothetical protein